MLACIKRNVGEKIYSSNKKERTPVEAVQHSLKEISIPRVQHGLKEISIPLQEMPVPAS